MKVTVCFGNIRVVVPCGNGDLLVTELIEKAIFRYKKALNKPADYWVRVHSLKSLSDGGILDFDDRLSDVTDDREQIIAIYEEQDAPSVPHNGGDGTSASSIGTSSPDMFQNELLNNNNEKNLSSSYMRHGNKNDVIITHNDLTMGSSLIVRRGSEPALNNIGKGGNNNNKPSVAQLSQSQTERPTRSFAATKRWSAIASIDETKASRMSRADPVGGSGHGDDDSFGSGAASPLSPQGLKGELIEMVNEGGPLGIHVVPDFDHSGRDMGLVIQGIEAGGRIYRDGRLKVQDRIIEINGTSLVDVEFNKAQDVFKQALQTERILLRVIRAEAPPLPKQPPPLLPRPNRQKPSNLDLSQNSVPSPIKLEDLTPAREAESNAPATQPEKSPRKVPPVPPARHPSTALSASPTKKDAPPLPAPKSEGKPKLVAPTNTRKIGKKINITLTKGPEGLGFSVTTRDNPAGGNAPIYIKNILPKGAAVKDGRLKSGDRLLEVNELEMTGKSQAEAVSVLRNTKLGSTVKIVVSRQVVEEDDQFAVPRELPKERAGVPADDSVLTSTANREVIALKIPLNDTGSAGLGVSVKGKTSTTDQGTQDLGIFIKSVITGGAASKDGRLLINDQLLEVNGENLSEKSNADAMETLRLAMQKEANQDGFIRVVVGRRPGMAQVAPSTPTTPRELRISMADPADSHNETLPPVSALPPGLPPKGRDLGAGGDSKTVNGAQIKAANKNETNKLRNPSVDRVASGGDGGGIRNLSYMRATHDSILDSFAEPASPVKSEKDPTTANTSIVPKTPSSPHPFTSTPTATPTSAFNTFGSSARLTSSSGVTSSGDVIQIDESTTYQVKMRDTTPSKLRPASTIGFSRSMVDPASSARAGSEPNDGAPKPPDWLVEWDKQRNSTSSELSPTEQQIPFSRDAFGRQSMSEKRHGHLDPRISEFYKKIKETRGQPFHSDKRSSADVGPTLGLKKSSSLESLQTAVQDATLEDGEANQFRSAPNRGMVRGRGCNDSFRAAVDRSYDTPNNDTETMETLEEESSEAGSTSARGSVSAAVPVRSESSVGDRGDTRSSKSSLSSNASHPAVHDPLAQSTAEERKSGKKKGGKKDKEKGGSGIFKGLGHMFRFGKHRKGEDEAESRGTSRERSADSRPASRERQHEDGKVKDSKARKVAQNEHEKIQEQYRKLQEKTRQLEQQQQQKQGSAGPDGAARKGNSPPSPPASRAERIQQLRTEHQRRHRERQGQYPSDRKEEIYEQKLLQFEKQGRGDKRASTIEGFYSSTGPGDYAPRRPPPPPSTEYDRPGSRLGYADPAERGHGYPGDLETSRRERSRPEGDGRYDDRDRYSHYQNYHEIQAQLAQHEYYQQRYQQYLAHHQAALAHSAHAHHHASLSASQLMPPPLPPRSQTDFHPHHSSHRAYPATEPRGNWTDHRHHHMLIAGGGHPRSLTPSLPHESTRSSSPSRSGSVHTPMSQVGYMSHHHPHPHAQSLSASMLPPAAPLHSSQHSYSLDYMAYDDRMMQRQGAYGADSSQFGSLPRRSERRQTGTVSEAARV